MNYKQNDSVWAMSDSKPVNFQISKVLVKDGKLQYEAIDGELYEQVFGSKEQLFRNSKNNGGTK